MKHCGGNIYYVYKLGATVGSGLYHMGAQMRGESYEAFLVTAPQRSPILSGLANQQDSSSIWRSSTP